MKLRIRGNSIRFRLQQSEVRALLEHRHVEEQTRIGLGPEERFTYRIELSDRTKEPIATLHGTRLIVSLPISTARAWAEGKELTLGAVQSLGGGETLRILVEKDLACVVPRAGEDDKDAYPNPEDRC